MGLFWLPFGLTPKPRGEGPRYADIYVRAVAAGVDLMLLFTLLMPFFEIVRGWIFRGVDTAELKAIESQETFSAMLQVIVQSDMFVRWLLNSGFQLTVIGTLIVCVQAVWGNTPGKRLLGITVVRAGTLEPLPWWRFAVRFAAYIPSALPFMIGIFWASFNKQRRGWHDYIAGTVVIHLRPEGWYWDKFKELFRKYVRRSPQVRAD